MKLNRQGRDELRAKLVEQLQSVPEGQRIHLDKDLLEELIFETSPFELYDGGEKIKAIKKTIVWSGQFLSKIDLSEISFDNVDWENHDEDIDLSNTNVKIDFSKAFTGDVGAVDVSNCNFANVDLSNSHVEEVGILRNCNFSNTNANVFGRSYPYQRWLYGCDFSNNNFSTIEISSYYFYAEDGDESEIENCNFSNTGLKIKYIKPSISFDDERRIRYTLDKYDAIVKSGKHLSDEQIAKQANISEILQENEHELECAYRLSQYIKAGFLDGCYVDDKLIHSEEEAKKNAQEKRTEYEQMKEDLISSTMSNIEEQVSGFGRK